MGDVVAFKRPRPSEKHKGRGLCQSSFHKWAASGETRFDVKQGGLVTRLVCARCGATKVEAR